MKVLEQCVTLVTMTPEPLAVIKRMGEICYQSDSSKTDEVFCKMLINRGHVSVLEHASMSVIFDTDRGISHEIVRHRVGCSYSQESTRYVKYGDLNVMRQEVAEAFDTWEGAMLAAEAAYSDLIDKGMKPEVARSVLPTCVKTQIGMTANFTAWRHFLRLCLSPKAHPMIRKVAAAVWLMLPRVVTSDICMGCGCKPYVWSNNPIGIHLDSELLWTPEKGAPKDRYFPLCCCS